MHHAFVLAVFAFAVPMMAAALPTELPAIGTALRDRLAPHPRLFLNHDACQALIRQAGQDPRLMELKKRLLASADALLKLPPLEHKLEGRRMLGVSREALHRIGDLSLAYRLTGDRRYFKGARDTLLTVAAFKDWHPPHFLDVAEMTTGVAIGYDWLYSDLTPAQRATIREAIIQNGLNASYATPPMWWVNGANNWNQVCNGGMTLGALAIAEDEPELARRTIERAIQGVPHVMHQYAPDGAYPEGMMYWDYGTTYNCLLIGALQSALGNDFGLLEQPGFLKTAEYRLHLVGPTGLNFSYSDGAEHAAAQPSAAEFFLARCANDPSALFNEVKSFDRLQARADADHGRFDWLLMVWAAGETSAPPKPATTHYIAGGETPVATFRSSWDAGATFIGIKAGSPSASHAHMDVGSFCLDADGLRWASDLGLQSYNDLETKQIDLWNGKQNSQRWQVYRLGPMSHNILTVDGKEQRVNGHASIVRSNDHSAVIDATAVYADQLASARRGITLRSDKSVRLQDEIHALPNASATVRWAMVTHADVKVEGSTAILSQKGKTLQLRVVSPAGAMVKIISTDPPHDYDAPNPGTRLITFEVKLAPGESRVLAVDFTPGGSSSAPQVVPLDNW